MIHKKQNDIGILRQMIVHLLNEKGMHLFANKRNVTFDMIFLSFSFPYKRVMNVKIRTNRELPTAMPECSKAFSITDGWDMIGSSPFFLLSNDDEVDKMWTFYEIS